MGVIMEKITRTKLVEILKAVKGFCPIFIQYGGSYTKSRTVKGKHLLNQKCFMNCSVNLDYQEAVKRRLIKEEKSELAENFEALPPKGMEFVEGTKTLVRGVNTGKLSLRVARFKNNSKKTFLIDNASGSQISFNEAIAKDFFQPAFYKEKNTVGRGTVNKENDFDFAYIGLDRIEYVSINHMKYLIQD
jgi:hypothetical protein